MENKMKMKFFVLAFGLILGLLAVSTALADDIDSMTVYVDGNAVWNNGVQLHVPAIERNDYTTVRVVFTSDVDLTGVKVRAWINGYREEIESATGTFDVFEDIQYTKTVTLKIPQDLDAKDDYTLHVEIENKKELTGENEAVIDLTVQRIDNNLDILNLELWSYKQNPTGFEAGSTVYLDVVLKNTGNHLAEDVFVTVNVPELKITRTVYFGDVGSYDNGYEDAVKKTIALTLPADAESGNYIVEVEAFNSKIGTSGTKTLAIADTPDSEDTEAEATESTEAEAENGFSWETFAMVVSIILAVAIIALLVILLVKQKPNDMEKPEIESYY